MAKTNRGDFFMKKSIKTRVCKDLSLFLMGGLAYGLIEILWRRRTHISMVITGGLCFIILYKIFKKCTDIALISKCVIGSAVITVLEFFCGCIVNLWLRLNVWDYSNVAYNLLGQICLYYSILWGLLTIPISIVCKGINKFNPRRFLKQKQKESCCSSHVSQ